MSFLGDSLVGQALGWPPKEEKDLITTSTPIAPEMKELVWGFGSFIVMFLILRYVLYPKLNKGMDARAEALSRT